MFIDIVNTDLSNIDLDGIIKKSRNREGKFTPEIVEAFLSLTNHYSNIKFVANGISMIKDKDEQLAFKDVVISMVERREQPKDVLSILRSLAVDGGYVEEFDEANNKKKWFGFFLSKREKAKSFLGFKKGLDELSPPVVSSYDVSMGNLKNIDYISVLGGSLRLSLCNFAPDAEVCMYEVDVLLLEGVDKISKKFPFNECGRVVLNSVDLAGVEKVEFKEDAVVEFDGVTNIGDVDFSKCDVLKINDCDLTNVKKITFDRASKVHMKSLTNLPEILDFSNVDFVDLTGCDLSRVKEIKFKEGGRAVLDKVVNMPENLDVSMLRNVSFRGADLSNVKELKVTKGVNLEQIIEFPQVLDCAEVDSVKIGYVDVEKVKEIKNNEGKRLFIYDARNIPEECDFSAYDEVKFQYTHFGDDSYRWTISIKDKVKIKAKSFEVDDCYTFPKLLDLSECDEVVFNKCYFKNNDCADQNIKFKKGSNVCFSLCSSLPKNLDVSMCDTVVFDYSRLGGVESIKFRDEQQAKMALESATEFAGKILYEDGSQKVIVPRSSLEL